MANDYIARTLQAYDSRAKKYEANTRTMPMSLELETFVSLLSSKKQPVLDAGCAYGRDMAALVQHGLEPIGIDMSDELLSRGRELHPEFNFKKMDVRKLDFADNYFSGVWCNAVLLHLKDDDVARSLQEFYRVLIPGGIIALGLKEGEGSEEVSDSDGIRFYNYQTLPKTKKLLQKAGFHIQKSYSVNERQRFGADKSDHSWIYCFATKPA